MECLSARNHTLFLGSLLGPSHPPPAKSGTCIQSGRSDRSAPPDPSQYYSCPRPNLESPLPAAMYLGTDICGYLAGMGTSAEVILKLTDTSVYSGRVSLERSSQCPGLKTSGMQYRTVHGILPFWGESLICTETWRNFFFLLSHVRGTSTFPASADPHL